MLDDSKQAVESYDNTHRMEQLDAFTEQTIASVDEYLRGEREAEQAKLKTFIKHEGNLVFYETGVVAPDGYREMTSEWLCWRCDRPAEYGGYCEEHFAEWQEEQAEDQLAQREEWQAEASDPSGWTQSQREEYAQALDEEYDEYWSQHCVKHGESLREDGSCVQCEAELADERRNDL